MAKTTALAKARARIQLPRRMGERWQVQEVRFVGGVASGMAWRDVQDYREARDAYAENVARQALALMGFEDVDLLDYGGRAVDRVDAWLSARRRANGWR